MGITADTDKKPQGVWGKTCRKTIPAQFLTAFLLAGSPALVGGPLESESVRTDTLLAASTERFPSAQLSTADAAPVSPASVSAFSATRSNAGRILLAAELGDRESSAQNIRAAHAMFPFLPAPAPQLESAAQTVAAPESSQGEESEAAAAVGRSLRAYTRDEDEEVEAEGATLRRRAAVSNAISRAAAAGALSLPNPNSTVSNSLNAARFMAPIDNRQFDPGFSQAAEMLSVIPGLRIQTASIFAGFSSNSTPRQYRGGAYGAGLANDLGADYDIGASAVIQYSHVGRHGTVRLDYSPSHVQRSRIPEWSSTDHRLSLQTTRDLTPRLTLNLGGRAGNVGLEQFWVEAPEFRRVNFTPTDPSNALAELLDKVQSGEISDDEFAAILTGSPVVDNPGGSQQDLSRILSLSANANLAYAYSRRLSLTFGASTSSNQIVQGDLEEQLRGNRYISNTQSSNAVVGAAYRHSSRTRVSATLSSSLSDSTFARSLSHSPTVTLQQSISRHWHYEVGGGVGTIRFLESPFESRLSDNTTWTASGGLKYINGGHAVGLNASKRVGDQLGLGSQSTATASLMWNWQGRSSKPWGATAGISFSRADFGGALLREYGSTFYNAGISRRLTPSTSFQSDYYYGDYESPFSGVASNMSLHRLQMSLVWRPAEPR